MALYLSHSRIQNPIWLEPNDISFFQTRISEAETLIQTVESQMDEPSANISELTRQKDAKLVEIALLRNVLAPVRRVPLEILSEIFELVSAQHRRWASDIVSCIFGLSSVCVAWRKAAHASPRLWSILCISFEEVVLGPELIWVEDWITRSRTVPLDLYLDFYLEEYDEFGEVLKERGKRLLEYILTQFGHKVRLLNVAGHPSSFLPILHLSPSSSLLSLEDISLMISGDGLVTLEDLVDLCPRKVEVFLGAPKLRQVELNDAFLMELLALPAEQLTSLKVYIDNDLEDPAMFVSILSRCKQLVNLEIHLPSKFSMRLFVLLPTLRSLNVPYPNAAGSILCCITAPVLQQLHIRYYSKNLDSLLTDMTAFQQRSSTALSSLNLNMLCSDNAQVSTEKVVRILSLFPAIHSLEIQPGFNPDLLIQAMIYDCSKGQSVLPNLKNLVLRGYARKDCDKDYLSASGLKTMVLSRWWPDGPDGDGSVSVRNGLSRLQKVSLQGFRVGESAEDITHVSALSGLVLDYIPVKEC